MKLFYAVWALALAGCIIMVGKAVKVSTETLSPSELVTKYCDLASQGKIDEALTLWANQCTPDNGVCANATLVSGQNPDVRWTKDLYRFKDKIVNIEYEKIENNSASVLVNMKTERGVKTQDIYKLVKQKGSWKIQTVTTPALEETDAQIDYSRLGID